MEVACTANCASGLKMLQQILKDMYIDPQLLAELDEEQKHILFCKMREEQVRRWKEKEDKMDQITRTAPRPGSKRVNFLLGEDGEPWTWVMGEHPNDPSIDEILEREAKDKARQQATLETVEQIKNVENTQQIQPENNLEIKIDNQPVQLRRKKKNAAVGGYSLEREVAALLEDSGVQTTVDRNTWLSQKQQEIKNREESLKHMVEQRSNEIYQEIKAQQRKSLEAAERESVAQEELWMEQEKKAKEVEKQIREIARLAREEHKRALFGVNNGTFNGKEELLKPSVPPKVFNEKPLYLNNQRNGTILPSHSTSRSKDAKLFTKSEIMNWFLNEEYPLGAVDDNNGNNPALWFHGFISRPESEQMLMHQPEGSFLVRVHERIKGYVISYRASEKCKHYLIDASLGHCQFFGANQTVFARLKYLIDYHVNNPITAGGQEQLLLPCPRNNSNTLLSVLSSVKL
ncbi:SH2 domain-containing protein 4B-like isoform X2 [Ornithodoros turicata]|uniref:SH2 domain-containing protein 4B-like isoform X2 n=1 Tax=Ornithodoros turicata TaxID=34597 RepID=UPI00313A22EF